MSWLAAVNMPMSVVTDFFARVLLGLMTTLIFFFSIFLHEFGHCLVAKRERLEIREILLYPFGGLSRFKRPPDNSQVEFLVAIAGPATSFLVSFLFLIFWFVSNATDLSILTPIFSLLFLWNLLLAVFNLFPGYPLDGGRIMRAVLWKRGNNLNEATVLSGKAGQIIGVGLIIVGLFIALLRGDFFTGLWTVIVGVFLFDAAKEVIKEIDRLDETKVGQVMSLPISVAPDDNVLHFVDNILPKHRLTTFLVAKERALYGVLLLEDLKKLEKSKWHKTKIAKVMRGITADYFVESDFLLADARELMKNNGIGALGVIDSEGNLVGYLQRGKIRRIK